MQCPVCHHEWQPDFAFCPLCGTALPQQCAGCGAALPADFGFCPHCGRALKKPAESGPNPAPPLTEPSPGGPGGPAADAGAADGERRLVTVLFTDIVGSTRLAEGMDPEEWREIVNRAHGLVSEAVYRHEGTVAQLLGDGVLAFFGAPVGHEDDARRAIRAALEIQAGVLEYAAELARREPPLQFEMRAGLNSGLVVAGRVGTSQHAEYLAVGDTVNIAARLESAADPGSVLASEATYRLAAGVFDFEDLGPVAVKGKAEPVRAYRVVRAREREVAAEPGAAGYVPPMVGRNAELKLLEDTLATVREDGELQIITVLGEPGIGKSRLRREFEHRLASENAPVTVWRGRGRPELQAQAYGLLRDLLSTAFGMADSDSGPEAAAKLESGVAALVAGESGTRLAHLSGQLVGLDYGASPYIMALRDNPRDLRAQSVAALAGILRAAARRRPLVLLFDDAHWADDSSLDTLNEIAQTLAGETLLVTYLARPTLIERRPHWGEGQLRHRRLVLQLLSKRDSRRLVESILTQAGEAPDELEDWIVERAEGNPFFAEELIKMYLDTRAAGSGGEQGANPAHDYTRAGVPTNLTGVLQARLDRLAPAGRALLQQAAVIGRVFWEDALAAMQAAGAAAQDAVPARREPGGDRSRDPGRDQGRNLSGDTGAGQVAAIRETLAALRSAGLIYRRESSAFAGSEEYIFKHALLREVAYESLLRRQRERCHGLVADWLIARSGERAAEFAGVIAGHLEQAGQLESAIERLLQVGDRARALYAHREAAGAYEHALALLATLGDAGRAARTLMKLAGTYHTALDFNRAQRTYSEAFVMWQKAGLASQGNAPPAPARRALRVLMDAPVTADPAQVDSEEDRELAEQLFSGLLAPTPEMDPVPDVAQSWETLEGGRVYRFHLREDARWSDGEPVVAEDFVCAWQRVLDPAIRAPTACHLAILRGGRAALAGQLGDRSSLGVRALDSHTLLVELEEPASYWPLLLAHEIALPVPRHLVDQYGPAWSEPGKIASNGAFALEKWEENTIRLRRNPHYHGPWTGNVERVVIRGLAPSEAARTLHLYASGEFDVALMHTRDAAVAYRDHGEELLALPLLRTRFIGFDATRPPFDDARARQALAMAMDRQRIANIDLRGRVAPAEGGLLPQGMPGHAPGIALPYDPDRARRLLAAAGYPGGRGFPQVTLTSQVAGREEAERVARYWLQELGIDLPIAYAKYARREAGATRTQLFQIGWQADFPDPEGFLPEGELEEMTGWRDSRYQMLIEAARRAQSQAERLQLYQLAERILIEEAVVVPLFYPRSPNLIKTWVKRYPISPMKQAFWKDVVLEPEPEPGLED